MESILISTRCLIPTSHTDPNRNIIQQRLPCKSRPAFDIQLWKPCMVVKHWPGTIWLMYRGHCESFLETDTNKLSLPNSGASKEKLFFQTSTILPKLYSMTVVYTLTTTIFLLFHSIFIWSQLYLGSAITVLDFLPLH